MDTRMKSKPALGIVLTVSILMLGLLSGLTGELTPARAMDLQTGTAPVANNDTFGFKIGTTYSAAAPGVLANDTDADGEVISALPVESGYTTAGGTYTLYANGSFTYTPLNNSVLSDSFTYMVVDTVTPQLTSNVATVNLVGSTYDIKDDRYGFRTGVFRFVYPAIGVLSNDKTVPLPTGAYVELFGSGPTHGTLIKPAGQLPSLPSGLQSDGSFAYYPDNSGALTDQFQYIVKDANGNQIGGPATVLLTNSVTCSVDVDGPNDEPGQGDLTQFCRDTYYEGTENELALSVNWDEVTLGGTNSADACALFDTDGDRGVNYSLCMSWQNNGNPTPGYPKFYSCSDEITKPLNCWNYVEIPQTNPRFSCRLLETNDDPFTVGDYYPYDTKAICYIPYAGNFGLGANVRFLDVCAYPSRIPNSDYKDCIRYSTAGIPTLKVYKDVEGVPTYRSAEWIIGISPLPIRPLNTTGTAPADNHLIDDDETPMYAVNPGNYTITETAGTITPYPYLTLSSQTYQCANIGGETVVYYPGPTSATWGSGGTITNLPIALSDNWTCTFKNTYSSVTAISLYDFKATAQLDNILLQWTTVSEYNNRGFNLFRATDPQGTNKVKLNARLIPSIDPGGMEGGEYSYVDNQSLDRSTTYYYWLQDVDLNGTLTMHGPVSARLAEAPETIPVEPGAYQIFLPSIIR